MSLLDARLFAGLDELDDEVDWPGLGQVHLYSRRSPAKTTTNEDAALAVRISETQALVAVADGVGGMPAGEQASAEALRSLLSAIEKNVGGDEGLDGVVMRGIDLANHAVQALATGSATTLAVLTIDEARVRAYHVGDSGILAVGGRGKVKLETIAHSPVGYGVEAGLIATDDALEHEERHFVSNVVGCVDMYMGVSSSLHLAERDRVLLASDGLFDNLTVAEVVETIRKGELAKSVRALAAASTARMVDGGHPDDMTMVVFRPGS